MKRRNFLQILGCSALFPAVQDIPAKPAIILDYRENWHGGMEELLFHGQVFVDGKQIRQVFYVDTGRGLVMTYDVLGDNKAYCGSAKIDWPRGTFTPPHGPAYRELFGEIELFTKDGERIA